MRLPGASDGDPDPRALLALVWSVILVAAYNRSFSIFSPWTTFGDDYHLSRTRVHTAYDNQGEQVKANKNTNLPVVRRRRGRNAVLTRDLSPIRLSAWYTVPRVISRREKQGGRDIDNVTILGIPYPRAQQRARSADQKRSQVTAMTQAETDGSPQTRLSAPAGGKRVRLVRDRWGVSWQITPIAHGSGHNYHLRQRQAHSRR